MAKAKFTQEQVLEAMAEFLVGEDASWSCTTLPAAGYNGQITIYKKEEQNGTDERPSN